MILLKTVLLGLVEGVTEFLPISSTAHLILVSKVIDLPQSEYWKFFTVFIQSGAILAVFFNFLNRLKGKKLFINLAASFIPTAVVGLVFYKLIKSLFFESTILMVFTLILFGIIFLVIEYLVFRKSLILKKELKNLSIKEAVIVGVFQSFAVILGVSRAGAVLISGMLMGYRRSDIAMYSFLLAVPTILAASFFDLLKTPSSVVFSNIGFSVLGFITAFISALVVVKWLIKYLQNNTLVGFGLYRIVLGLLLLVLLFI